ncbi:MAG TPA: NADH-quinone oxidoreductase subunit C [Acidimicrobiales bacterium]|nr:NADH-quinone oxidoreductase subunit C [Acidimicrobiales bacterium]
MRDQAPEAPPVEVDELREGLLATLREALGEAVVGSEVAGGDICVRVDRTAWKRAAEVCRDRLHMDYFCFLSGIDWLPAPGLSGEKVFDPDAPTEGGDEEPTGMETGVAGGDTRFQVFARLYSTRRKVGITLKADLDDADPAVESWTELFRGADWHERETWEMYGFRFDGHPRLSHIYLPGEFEGYPLRKDFPLLAREVKPWPGLVDVEPMPGEPEGDGEEAAAE